MPYSGKLFVAFVLICFVVSPAANWAQSDAETALAAARTAFEAGEYSEAAELLETASQTDSDNPDIFLLLGRSRYQLGDVDAALVAWQRTLKIAPDQAYARRMVDSLRGKQLDADTRLDVIESLLNQQLASHVHPELVAVGRMSLSQSQSIRLLTLKAESMIAMGQGQAALGPLLELVVRAPDQADSASIRLLIGKAKLATPDMIPEALSILEKVKADFADTAEGASADLALIVFRVDQAEGVVEELGEWMDRQPDHAELPTARQAIVRAVSVFISAAGKQDPPEPEDELSEAELNLLTATERALPTLKRSQDSLQLTQLIAGHIESRLIAAKAYAAADTALDRLLKLNLPSSSRGVFEKTLTRSRHAAASDELGKVFAALSDGDESAAALADWVEAHQTHPRLLEARRYLVVAHLKDTARSGSPIADSTLSDSDRAAVQVVDTLFSGQLSAKERAEMVQTLLAHWQAYYVDHGAFAAAIEGLQATLELPLAKPNRRTTLTALANSQAAAALSRITGDVEAGICKSGPLPDDLVSLNTTFQLINNTFPDHPSWGRQAEVAASLSGFSGRIPWPAKVTDIKPTDDWALQLAIPVIRQGRDEKATTAALTVIDAIVNSIAASADRSAARLAQQTHQQLLDALPETHRQWPTVARRQMKLRVTSDAVAFQRSLNAGQSELVASLTEQDKSLLELASRLISRKPSMADDVLADLQPFLQRRTEAGFDESVREAYAFVESALPPAPLRKVRLAIAESRIDAVIADHTRLLRNGFQPPRELDAAIAEALVDCYELQSGLDPENKFVADVRRVKTLAVTHYRNLRFHEVAAEAIAVKADQGSGWLDATAEFELATLHLSIAMEELARQSAEFQGREQLTLTPAVTEAIAGFERFIRDRSDSPLVGAAVNKILAVGKAYQGYQQSEIAAEVYARLETFAANEESLVEAMPGKPTVSERAAIARAAALHAKATRKLREAIAGQPDQTPPTRLSEDFQEALAAYQGILRKYPEGPMVQSAISELMRIALQHAEIDAWDVAAGVYQDLLAQELPLREPERLELAQALCEMGKVIGGHARQVLAAITLWETPVSSGTASVSQIAAAEREDDMAIDDLFGERVTADTGETDGMEMAMGTAIAGGAMGLGGVRAGGMGGGGMLENADASTAVADMDAAELPMDPFGATPPPGARAVRQRDLLAAVRQQQSEMASQIAMLRDEQIRMIDHPTQSRGQTPEPQQQAAIAPAVLSDAELERRQRVLDDAYTQLQAIRNAYAGTTTARQARDQVMVIANHWRGIRQWQRAAELMKRYLVDNATDIDLPKLRHDIARDYLAWASSVVETETTKQELLDEVNRRFALARTELLGIIAAFPDQTALKHKVQWDIATSHLSQARVVARFSSTLARGQFVRAANELLATADLYHDHPQIGQLPQLLWNISQELAGRRFYDEAITVWNEMTLHYPGDPLAEQAATLIAQTYQNQLRLPLRAVESYLELNFARGGNDVALQDAIFQIASQLKGEKRWVEALHVLETFVDSFPSHASAGQALTMIGQVHQTNEVWEDAIAAYRRVILEYDQGNWAQQSKWSIAECTINLSRWEEAQGAYREFQKAYPEDGRVAEAAKRLEILKDLARFQKVVDEEGQRKAFDAQFQIASIVRTQLANPVKSIIEYRKVAERWPGSHLADDALFQVGMIYMELGQTENARGAFLATAEKYPTSPLADDALFQVGASFEGEAQMLTGVTRGKAIEIANELAQRQAYAVSQDNRKLQRARNSDQIAQLKKAGKRDEADKQTAFQAALNVAFDQANASVVANWAAQQEQALTTAQLADRQDKINAALRKAVASFRQAASVASADKADDALLRMAQIYDQRLKDSDAAMATWLEIVKQYSGTTVAEDASWKIAQYYETHEKYGDAIAAYNSFLRNYRRSPKASAAQAAIAENHEQLGNWVEAMDAYTNYINNYPDGSLASKAKEQIAWIKTYRL